MSPEEKKERDALLEKVSIIIARVINIIWRSVSYSVIACTKAYCKVYPMFLYLSLWMLNKLGDDKWVSKVLKLLIHQFCLLIR